MMYGVRNKSRLVLLFLELSLRNSQPTSGSDPSTGTFFTSRMVRSWMRPPSTTVSWSLATTVVLALRFESTSSRT